MNNFDIMKLLNYGYLYELEREYKENILIIIDAGASEFGGSLYIDRLGYQSANSIVPEFVSNKNIRQKDIKGKEYTKTILIDVDYIRYFDYSEFKNNEQLKEILNIRGIEEDGYEYYDFKDSLNAININTDGDDGDYIDGVIVFRKGNISSVVAITKDDIDYWNSLNDNN